MGSPALQPCGTRLTTWSADARRRPWESKEMTAGLGASTARLLLPLEKRSTLSLPLTEPSPSTSPQASMPLLHSPSQDVPLLLPHTPPPWRLRMASLRASDNRPITSLLVVVRRLERIAVRKLG